ncbi:MAG: NADH-quinone oxidoreductase subunit M [Gammaproteobacteria bacterium]|nr:NADH-quinone oxidoreductase subunit M [Gammaproteobacteria bacterium]
MLLNEIQWSQQTDYPFLAMIQLLPLLAIAVVNILKNERAIIFSGVLISVVEFALVVNVYRLFDSTNPVFQFAENFIIAGPIVYHAAVDGVSILFMLLTALLSFLVILYSYVRGFAPWNRFLTVLFAVEAALMSMFVTLDLLWFSIMSALQLIPVSYLLWRWSTSPEKDIALTRFLQFMFAAVVLLLAGTIMLAWNYSTLNNGEWTFDIYKLIKTPVDAEISSVVFFLLFYGLAIRVPLFPFHGWLPITAEHGTIAIAPMFLLGLKTGIYGLYRFVFPILPDAVLQWHQFVVGFAVAGVFYAALLALMQVNVRRLLAYAVVSHTGILVIGLFSLNDIAFMGTIMLSATFGLAITGLLFATGIIYQRTGTALFEHMGGLMDYIPVVGVTFLLASLSIIGMPGTPGFDAVHLVLEAAIHRFGALVTIAAAVGNVIAAGFLLRAFQYAFLTARTGDKTPPKNIEPTRFLEYLVCIILVLVLLVVGFYSEPWLQLISKSVEGLGTLYTH